MEGEREQIKSKLGRFGRWRADSNVAKLNSSGASMHYGFCPLVKLTFKDLAKLTALAAIFKTKSYFR